MATKPDFRDVILANVDIKHDKRRRDKLPHRDFRVRVPLSAVTALRLAAERRGMSVSAYARRAAIAFVAHDLGISLTELLRDEPLTRHNSMRIADIVSEGGRGHGPWNIERLE